MRGAYCCCNAECGRKAGSAAQLRGTAAHAQAAAQGRRVASRCKGAHRVQAVGVKTHKHSAPCARECVSLRAARLAVAP
jgi:hypothetical protein